MNRPTSSTKLGLSLPLNALYAGVAPLLQLAAPMRLARLQGYEPDGTRILQECAPLTPLYPLRC